MTKQIFAESVSKVVPVVGGFVFGGITYVTFKQYSIKLKEIFQELNLSDSDYYAKEKRDSIIDMDSYDDIDKETVEPDWNQFAAIETVAEPTGVKNGEERS